jgi:predicted RNA-binding Zn-ribbon protein involved in translation (DUF1610 family)
VQLSDLRFPPVLQNNENRLTQTMIPTALRCIGCGESVEKSVVPGAPRVCPRCETVAPLPPSRQRDIQLTDALVIATEVKFICPACGGRLRDDLRKAGQTVNCPKCAASMRVPVPSAKMLPTRVGDGTGRENTARPEVGKSVPSETPVESLAMQPASRGNPVRKPAAGRDGKSVFDILEKKLATAEERSVVIESLSENEVAGEFALQLAAVFCAVGWSIARRSCAPGKAPDDGLALVAGACPFPEEVAQIYAALSVTGLNFTCLIDPDQIREAAIVRVGANPLG